jgi:hypothetical protein
LTGARASPTLLAGKEEPLMDWIEQLFGLSPDGGDGSTELMWLLAFVVIVIAVAWRRGLLAHLFRRIGR